MNQNVHPLAEPFRHSLRGLAASVTILSTQHAGVRYGMVATAVMSLSMEPPSVAIAINSTASIHGPLLQSGYFVVNIVSRWDECLVRGFAKASGEARFAHGTWKQRMLGSTELPYLGHAQSTIFCKVQDAHEAGSHTLIAAAVEDVIVGSDKSPLIYCDGNYGLFSPAAMPAAARTA